MFISMLAHRPFKHLQICPNRSSFGHPFHIPFFVQLFTQNLDEYSLGFVLSTFSTKILLFKTFFGCQESSFSAKSGVKVIIFVNVSLEPS